MATGTEVEQVTLDSLEPYMGQLNSKPTRGLKIDDIGPDRATAMMDSLKEKGISAELIGDADGPTGVRIPAEGNNCRNIDELKLLIEHKVGKELEPKPKVAGIDDETVDLGGQGPKKDGSTEVNLGGEDTKVIPKPTSTPQSRLNDRVAELEESIKDLEGLDKNDKGNRSLAGTAVTMDLRAVALSSALDNERAEKIVNAIEQSNLSLDEKEKFGKVFAEAIGKRAEHGRKPVEVDVSSLASTYKFADEPEKPKDKKVATEQPAPKVKPVKAKPVQVGEPQVYTGAPAPRVAETSREEGVERCANIVSDGKLRTISEGDLKNPVVKDAAFDTAMRCMNNLEDNRHKPFQTYSAGKRGFEAIVKMGMDPDKPEQMFDTEQLAKLKVASKEWAKDDPLRQSFDKAFAKLDPDMKKEVNGLADKMQPEGKEPTKGQEEKEPTKGMSNSIADNMVTVGMAKWIGGALASAGQGLLNLADKAVGAAAGLSTAAGMAAMMVGVITIATPIGAPLLLAGALATGAGVATDYARAGVKSEGGLLEMVKKAASGIKETGGEYTGEGKKGDNVTASTSKSAKVEEKGSKSI